MHNNPQYGTAVNQALLDIVNHHSLSQCIKDPTRNSNILGLVLTTSPDLIKSTIVCEGMSDHDLVITELDLKIKPPKKKPRKIFLFKRADVDRLRESISSNLEVLRHIECESASELDDLWIKCKSTILDAVEQNVPSKNISGRWHVPWLTPSLKRAIRKKQRLYRKAKQRKTHESWAKFKNFRKATKSKLLEAYNGYVSNLLDTTTNPDHPTLGKRFWSFIKSMKKDNVGISPLKENGEGEAVYDSKKKANLLSEQFKSVFTQEDLENLPSLPQAFPNISQLNFDTVGIAKLLISNLNVKKAAGPDQIPCWVLKNAAQEIAPFLQQFFSLSLQIGDIPWDWKNANVHAIFKKEDRSLASNHRPISLTSVSCKIMEHIIFSHIMSYLEEFKILSDIQHGFRKHHSCETQLLITLEDLARNLDHGKQSDIILLDFAKAFDTVPHQRLLLKLRHYGIQGTVNKWI